MGLMHLWVPLSGFLFDGAGSGDQGDIDYRSLLHGHSEVVLLKRNLERQDRRLIRNPIADQSDSCKAGYGCNLDKCIWLG
jgi:hypothetical protein